MQVVLNPGAGRRCPRPGLAVGTKLLLRGAALGKQVPPGTWVAPGVGTGSQGRRTLQNSHGCGWCGAFLVLGPTAAHMVLEELSLETGFHSFTFCFFLFLFLGAAPGSARSTGCGFSAAAGTELRTRATS